MYELIT